MNLLAEHEQKLAEVERLNEEIREIEQSEEYKQLAKFKSQLEKLMDDYSKSARDIIKLLQPESDQHGEEGQQPRRSRPVQTYRNPHTGEVVKTKGGNQRRLKAWREEYGSEAVDGWKS